MERDTTMNNFDQLMEQWEQIAGQYTWNDPTYAKLAFHVYLGQIFREIRVFTIKGDPVPNDGRISLLCIKPQGSGKGRMADALSRLSNITNTELRPPEQFRCRQVADWTYTGFVGTMILNQETKMWEQENGELDIRETNISITNEASNFFDAKQPIYKTGILNIILQTQTSIHSGEPDIYKKMALNRIHCRGHVSLFWTTRPTRDITAGHLQSGLFRRVLTYYDDVDIKQSWDTSISKLSGAETTSNDSDMRDIAAAVLKAREQNNQIEIGLSDEARSVLIGRFEYWKEQMLKLEKGGVSKDKIYTFKAIAEDYLKKGCVIGAHRALLDKRSALSKEDLKYGISIAETLIKSFGKLMAYTYNHDWTEAKRQDEEEKQKLQVSMLKKGKKYTYADLVALFRDKEGLAKKQADNRTAYMLRKMKASNSIIQNDDGTYEVVG